MKINSSYFYARNINKKFNKYEITHNIDNNKSIIVRLDGHNLSKLFKTDKKCFNKRIYDIMYNISKNIINYFPYIIRTYSFKDEISILIDYDKFKNNKYYKNREEKILSILSSYVSSMFNIYNNNNDNIYSFDARLISLENNEVDSYFKARKAYATYTYFDRLSSFYNIKHETKGVYNIHHILKQGIIKDEDLYEYICFGVEGMFIDDKWILTPDRKSKLNRHK